MATVKDLANIVEDLQQQIRALSARIVELEGRGAVAAAPPPAEEKVEAAAPAPPAPEAITEEEILAIAAAIGAYLGVRVHVRAIRLASSRAWAQEGRVSIQASHRLHS